MLFLSYKGRNACTFPTPKRTGTDQDLFFHFHVQLPELSRPQLGGTAGPGAAAPCSPALASWELG